MARPTDTTFGSGFNAATFRSAIRSTMQMGLPNNDADKATFRWTPQHMYDPQDPSHDPYSWTQTVESTTNVHADVQVPVAVEFSARPAGSQATSVGEFDTSRAILTLLDVDYALVQGADLVLLGGNTYEIEFVAPPLALFEVDVFQIYCLARDEA